MGIGFVLLIWAIFGAVAGVIAIIGVVAARCPSGFFKVAGVLAAVLGFSCATAACIFVIAGILSFARGPQYSTSRSELETEFQVAPGPDVQAVQSQSLGSTDFHEHFLRFRCSPRTITTIARRFRPASTSECQMELHAPSNTPGWWHPRTSPSTLCFVAKPLDSAFASNGAWLLYDPASRDTYFAYEGID